MLSDTYSPQSDTIPASRDAGFADISPLQTDSNVYPNGHRKQSQLGNTVNPLFNTELNNSKDLVLSHQSEIFEDGTILHQQQKDSSNHGRDVMYTDLSPRQSRVRKVVDSIHVQLFLLLLRLINGGKPST